MTNTQTSTGKITSFIPRFEFNGFDKEYTGEVGYAVLLETGRTVITDGWNISDDKAGLQLGDEVQILTNA